MPSIAIIGGGVIGLSIGWQLARENLSVHIFDQRSAGKQASWTAAGMLSPYSETISTQADLLEMGLQSLAIYPQFLRELEEDSQIALPQESEGTLWAAIDRDDREWLHQRYAFQKKNEIPVQWFSGDEARKKEPLLSARVNSAIWIPSEKQVNNHLLIKALIAAFLARGGVLTENTKIKQLWDKTYNVLDIQTEDGTRFPADMAVNATGAWAHQIDSSLVIYPIKGQMLHLKMPASLKLKGMIRTPRIYLAPKQDGTVRVGATSEDQGFNEEITAGATLKLLEHAWEAVPASSEYTIEQITAGLRPVTANHKPILGASLSKGFIKL